MVKFLNYQENLKKKGVYLKKIKSKVLQCEAVVHHIKIVS